MSTLLKRRLRRTFFVYVACAVLVGAFAQGYLLFGHGVRSAAMTWAFLYPLLGGALPFGLLWATHCGFAGHGRWRLGSNLYHAGLAALVTGSLLRGVFEIAGTGSPYLPLYTAVGVLCIAAGIGCIALPPAQGAARQK